MTRCLSFRKAKGDKETKLCLDVIRQNFHTIANEDSGPCKTISHIEDEDKYHFSISGCRSFVCSATCGYRPNNESRVEDDVLIYPLSSTWATIALMMLRILLMANCVFVTCAAFRISVI